MLKYIKDSLNRNEKVKDLIKHVFIRDYSEFIYLFKIIRFQYPHELRKKLSLDIHDEPLALSQILNDCQMAMDYSIRTAHPRNFNQISQGLDLISLAGEWITAATNTNMFTYEVAPVYNLIEKIVLEKMAKCCGWTEQCDGVFSPGKFQYSTKNSNLILIFMPQKQ